MRKHRIVMSALGAALVSGGFALGAQAENVASGDRQFADKAAIAGMAEVDAGKLAERRADDSQVKQFGQRMVHDHTQAGDRLRQIAATKGIDLPTKLDKHAQQEIDKLQKLSGGEFDREYVKAQVSDHEGVIKDFEKEASSGKDADLVKFAQTTLPTLREHLSLARAAEREAIGKSASNAKTSSAQSLAATRAGTGATRAKAPGDDRTPVPKAGG